jgi:hypothetical protein
MEVSDVRRRLRNLIEQARRRAAERRALVDQASRDYEQFLTAIAIPTLQTVAQALIGEGHRFKLITPGETVRLGAEFAPDDYLEIALDTDREAPAVTLRTSRGRGRRNVQSERVLDGSIAAMSDEQLVAIVLEELVPLIER